MLTASSDDTARIWSCETGKCLRILQGHQAMDDGVSLLGGLMDVDGYHAQLYMYIYIYLLYMQYICIYMYGIIYYMYIIYMYSIYVYMKLYIYTYVYSQLQC